MITPMRIYVASSWRNLLQAWVVNLLRRYGHEVYDFHNPAPGNTGFGWRAITEEPAPWSGGTLRAALRTDIARAGYGYDMAALRACDAVVLVLPCGRSAHWELGYAMGQGKRGYVVMFGVDEPELMYSEATILASEWEVFDALGTSEAGQVATRTGPAGPDGREGETDGRADAD